MGSLFLFFNIFSAKTPSVYSRIQLSSLCVTGMIYVYSPGNVSLTPPTHTHAPSWLLLLYREPFVFTCSIQTEQHVRLWAGGVGACLYLRGGKSNEELNMDTVCESWRRLEGVFLITNYQNIDFWLVTEPALWLNRENMHIILLLTLVISNRTSFSRSSLFNSYLECCIHASLWSDLSAV